MTETEIENGYAYVCEGVLADSPAFHGSLTVSPVFIFFVGGIEACCLTFTQNKPSDTAESSTHTHAYTYTHTHTHKHTHIM